MDKESDLPKVTQLMSRGARIQTQNLGSRVFSYYELPSISGLLAISPEYLGLDGDLHRLF